MPLSEPDINTVVSADLKKYASIRVVPDTALAGYPENIFAGYQELFLIINSFLAGYPVQN